MRLIRMLFVVQVIALLVDNPSISLPEVFKISCSGVLFYSLRFYSRPFFDIIYLVQYFLNSIVSFSSQQQSSASSQRPQIEIVNRRILTNYTMFNGTSEPTAFTTVSPYMKALPNQAFAVNFLDPSKWHAFKFTAHFALGPFFFVLAVLFAFFFWEIGDYSNRNEMKEWLARYVADGWWRRGGLGIALSVGKGYLCLCALFLLLFVTAREFDPQFALPSPDIFGGAVMLGVAIVLVMWLLGYLGVRQTEAAFLRYVSQNASYTSQIVLKRAVKSKTELGLALTLLIYVPCLYTLMQAVIGKD